MTTKEGQVVAAQLTVDQVLALPASVRVPDVAAALGVSPATAYRAAKNKTLGVEVHQVGRRMFVVRADLLRLLQIEDLRHAA